MASLDYDEVTDLRQLLELFGSRLLRSFHVALPCRVLKWDASKRKAQLEVLVADPLENEQGEVERETRPVLVEVPIIFPSMGGFRLSFPVNENDEVLAIFTSCSLAYWLAKGGKVDEDATRRGHLSDAVAIVGLQSFARAKAVPDDRVSLGNDDRTVEIALDSGEVRLGDNSASNYVALANLVLSQLQSIATALVSHTHTGGLIDGLTGPSNSTYTAGSVAATKVKAK